MDNVLHAVATMNYVMDNHVFKIQIANLTLVKKESAHFVLILFRVNSAMAINVLQIVIVFPLHVKISNAPIVQTPLLLFVTVLHV